MSYKEKWISVAVDRIIGSKVAENTKLDYAKWYGTEENNRKRKERAIYVRDYRFGNFGV